MATKTISARTVVAHNDATDSGNPMHDDEAARKLNFKGALVPGVTVYGYMTYSLVAYFGEAWLAHGCMQVRFRRPVYAGEKLVIDLVDSLDHGSGVVTVEARNSEGDVCVTSLASARPHPQVVAPLTKTIPLQRRLPESKWPAEREEFAKRETLGSMLAQFPDADADSFLDAMQDDHQGYRDGILHPAWLLRQANIIVDRNFDVGPWIHVASEIQQHAVAYAREPVEVRAQVIELFEKKGHEYFDLDVVFLANGNPDRLLMRVIHRAIYKMCSG